MSYFAGSLLNPKIPGGRDNRSRSAFDQYFPDMGQPVSPQAQMSMPRNEATLQTPLPTILNPSAAFRAFAEPFEPKPYLDLFKRSMKLSSRYRGLLS
jgi:hypothetical protein|tara:strand:- start:299 stop:589 length:291 start_codon:yes stop_codon:yes gene_type:complete